MKQSIILSFLTEKSEQKHQDDNPKLLKRTYEDIKLQIWNTSLELFNKEIKEQEEKQLKKNEQVKNQKEGDIKMSYKKYTLAKNKVLLTYPSITNIQK
jgi:hypothetical protein